MMKFRDMAPLIFSALLAVPAMAEDLDAIFSNAKKEPPKSKGAPAPTITETRSKRYGVPVYDFRSAMTVSTPEQRILLGFLEEGDLEQSLLQWGDAYNKTSFASTANGKALFGFLLFQNGLRANGVEELFEANPENIDIKLITAWKKVLPATHPIWSIVKVNWKGGFTGIFGEAAEVRVRTRQLTPETPISEIERIVNSTKQGTLERGWAEWELALAFALKDRTADSAKLLKAILERQSSTVPKDSVAITAARLLYEKGYLDKAIEYYEQVPKGSDLWYDAQEEIAWAFVRKGEAQNAIGQLHGITSPAFDALIGAETLYLKGIAHLKVCDYPVVADILKDYKTRFRPKAEKLQALSSNGISPASEKLVNNIRSGKIKLEDLGGEGRDLPRLVIRDEVLRGLVAHFAELESESQTADGLYNRSITGGSGRVGFQGFLGELRNFVEKRAQLSRAAVFNRIAGLAREELGEISQILQKLHIVEAELIQQLQLAKNIQKSSLGAVNNKLGRVRADAKNQIGFPDDGEIWLDEVSNFKVDLKKGCQVRKEGV